MAGCSLGRHSRQCSPAGCTSDCAALRWLGMPAGGALLRPPRQRHGAYLETAAAHPRCYTAPDQLLARLHLPQLS